MTQKNQQDEYFERFFEEKENIREFSYCEFSDNEMWDFNYTKEDMVKILQSFDTSTKQKIHNMLMKIDFMNGDVNDFLDHVFTGYVKMQMGEPLPN